jgi:hypothetical protein
MPAHLIINRKITDPENLAAVFNSFFLPVAENLNLHQVGREDPISFLKDMFSCRFHGVKIIPTSKAEIKSIILSLI